MRILGFDFSFDIIEVGIINEGEPGKFVASFRGRKLAEISQTEDGGWIVFNPDFPNNNIFTNANSAALYCLVLLSEIIQEEELINI